MGGREPGQWAPLLASEKVGVWQVVERSIRLDVSSGQNDVNY